MKQIPRLAVAVLLGLSSVAALADHGPGGSGGGVNTTSAETLAKGSWSLSLGVDYSAFEHIDDSEGLDRSFASRDHVDAVDHSLIGTVSVGYGIGDGFEIDLSTGYYSASNARVYDAGTEDPEEEPTVKTFDPDGMTDLWLSGKWRFHRSSARSAALFAALKAPTGDDEAVDSEGEEVEPPSRAGTGAWDGSFGFADTERISGLARMDASVRYTWHQEHDDFRIGDRLDLGVAFSYRVTAKHTPNLSLLCEFNARLRQHNDEGGEEVVNSGGKSLFASAGFVSQLNDRMAVILVGIAPLVEDLNGKQAETRFKVQTAVSFEF